jgi:hypothetical protein
LFETNFHQVFGIKAQETHVNNIDEVISIADCVVIQTAASAFVSYHWSLNT